jgi:uncharacterized protein (TIGR03790 family)
VLHSLVRCSAVILGVLSSVVSPTAADERPLSERVLVVDVASERLSRQVADHYMARRQIPEAHRCTIRLATLDERGLHEVEWNDYEKVIEEPIRRCLDRVGRDRILYIVFAHLTPYRLVQIPGKQSVAALDQYVADIWAARRQPGPEPNPYFATVLNRMAVYPAFRSLDEARRTPGMLPRPIYSVWRLDAATPALAEGLVDKAMEAEAKGPQGIACFDRKYGDPITKLEDRGLASGDWSLYRAAEFARQAGLTVLEDANEAEFGSAPAPLRCDGAAVYAGWYALNHYNDAFSWSVGAIGWHLDSASLLNPRGGTSWSPNALRLGITVTSGAVAEPFLQALPQPAGVVRNLLEGATVGDAFLRNTRWLKWQIVNVGDPLYRPFAGGRGPFVPGAPSR